MATDYTGHYTTTNGTRIDVAADRGTQLISRVTGIPLDATDPGHLLITATDANGTPVVLAVDGTEAWRLIKSIEIGIGVTETRDHNNDRFDTTRY